MQPTSKSPADTPAVNLDTETGSTAHIASGVTVGPSNPAPERDAPGMDDEQRRNRDRRQHA